MEEKDEKRIHKIVGVLLSAAMILGSVPGTALAAAAGKLFADGEIPVLLRTEYLNEATPDDRYLSGSFRLASGANAAIASASNAEVRASDSNALEVSVGESGTEEDAYLLDAEWLDGFEIPSGQKSVKKDVILTADGKVFEGKIELRHNWFLYNNYSRNAHVSSLSISPSTDGMYSGRETLTVKIFVAESDQIMDGVTGKVDTYSQELTLDFSGLSADETHEMRVEIYAGKARIGYCYITLPSAPKMTVNGVHQTISVFYSRPHSFIKLYRYTSIFFYYWAGGNALKAKH